MNGCVLQRFVIQGPNTFWLKVGKNNSFNAILAGVFLDKLDGPSTRWARRRSNWLGKMRYELPSGLLEKAQGDGPPTDLAVPPQGEREAAARELWSLAEDNSPRSGRSSLSWESKIFAFRVVAATGWGSYVPPPSKAARGSNPTLQALLKRWRWQLPYWIDEDRVEFQDVTAQAYQSLIQNNPRLQEIEY